MSDMICPFCGKQMYHPVGKATWSCQNWNCLKSEGMIGNHVLWQELIRTRKALDKANAELEYIKEQVEKSNAFIDARIKVAADQIARGIIAQVKNIKSKKE